MHAQNGDDLRGRPLYPIKELFRHSQIPDEVRVSNNTMLSTLRRSFQ